MDGQMDGWSCVFWLLPSWIFEATDLKHKLFNHLFDSNWEDNYKKYCE